jgi:hypothetical protein
MNNTTVNAAPVITPAQVPLQAQIAFDVGNFLFLEGAGGAGKTSIACKVLPDLTGRELWYVNLNGAAPTECLGYGNPQDNGDMEFYAPVQWPTEARVGDRPVLLVLDEINDYEREVRALLRSLYPAQGKPRVGTHVLGSNIRVVALGNRRIDGTSAKVEEAPFTTRCAKYTLIPDIGDWLAWAETQPDLVNSGSHVMAFLKFTHNYGENVDHFCPPTKMPYDGAPHPCPRQWEKVALAEPYRLTNKEAYFRHVESCVGKATTLAYRGFLQHVDKLPDIAALRKDPDSFEIPDDAAAQFALVSCCLATAHVGFDDLGVAVAGGKFDWLVSLLLRCRGDIREYGARASVRRGIPLDEHARSHDLIVG